MLSGLRAFNDYELDYIHVGRVQATYFIEPVGLTPVAIVSTIAGKSPARI